MQLLRCDEISDRIQIACRTYQCHKSICRPATQYGLDESANLVAVFPIQRGRSWRHSIAMAHNLRVIGGITMVPNSYPRFSLLANSVFRFKLNGEIAGNPINRTDRHNHNLPSSISIMEVLPRTESASLRQFIYGPRGPVPRYLMPPHSVLETRFATVKGNSLFNVFCVAIRAALEGCTWQPSRQLRQRRRITH